MELEKKARSVNTLIYAFNGAQMNTEGELTLTVGLGKEGSQVEKSLKFLIIRGRSAYNVILGRPALNAFRADAVQDAGDGGYNSMEIPDNNAKHFDDDELFVLSREA
ncbi:hypothetical protein PHJA_000835400 [Phtheirospermum japonicum]|uniref:Uncharacterized protein n=1 Tax=Phtheirospermum japonicum TaxID=374723 RepID=A0A830BJ88_9LAMI|nr:hypothetical protein PHJA_000835400 [Phtheirospermum japonicum]